MVIIQYLKVSHIQLHISLSCLSTSNGFVTSAKNINVRFFSLLFVSTKKWTFIFFETILKKSGARKNNSDFLGDYVYIC
eukprot:UN02886